MEITVWLYSHSLRPTRAGAVIITVSIDTKSFIQLGHLGSSSSTSSSWEAFNQS